MVTVDQYGTAAPRDVNNRIAVFAGGATGDATPTATIQESSTGLFYRWGGIAVDAAGRLYVGSQRYSVIASGPYTILVYAAEATGKAMPTATIGIAGPELSAYPRGFALDAVGRLYVAKRGVVDGSGSVLVYAVDPTWHLTLTAVIAGSHTGLFDPTGGIALDTAGRLYIVNGGASPACPAPCVPPSITVYPAGATGDATPTATIVGSNTGLKGAPRTAACYDTCRSRR